MLNRLLEQRWPITAVLSNETYTKISDARALKLIDEHWDLAAELSPVFKTMQVATTVISLETEPSSSICPYFYGIVHNHASCC